MNKKIEEKLRELSRIAKKGGIFKGKLRSTDNNLSRVLRNQADADHFMGEVEAILQRSKK